MDYMIWANGDFVRRSEATISMLDRGFRLGDVVFDTSRTFDGKVFRLREHLVRLYRSLQYTRIDPGMSIDEMERVTLDVVEHNEEMRSAARDDYMITQIVTRGAGGVVGDIEPHVSIMIDPIDYVRYAPLYDTGAHVVIPRTRSFSPDQIDPKVKHYSRMNFVLANLESADVDPDAFPVLLDSDGNIAEHILGNFFIVKDGVIRMPGDRSSLQGDTRRAVVALAAQLGVPTTEEDLQPYDAYTADEVFMTNTTYCIMPAGKIDNRPLDGPVPGPVTRQLQSAWSEMVGLDFVDQAVNYRRPQR